MLLDYLVAFTPLGLAGLFRRKPWGLAAGTLVGCAARFAIHYISGVTIYAILAPTELFGITFLNPWFYSLAYNLGYVLPSTILVAVVCFFLEKPLKKLPQ
jgi:thiamine transporter